MVHGPGVVCAAKAECVDRVWSADAEHDGVLVVDIGDEDGQAWFVLEIKSGMDRCAIFMKYGSLLPLSFFFRGYVYLVILLLGLALLAQLVSSFSRMLDPVFIFRKKKTKRKGKGRGTHVCSRLF